MTSPTPQRSLRLEVDGTPVVLDQMALPHAVREVYLTSLDAAATAIRDMQVRGAPLIGVTAAFGMALGLREDATDGGLVTARRILLATRPTAVNLQRAVEAVVRVVESLPPGERAEAAHREARRILEEEEGISRRIGEYGVALLREAWEAAGGRPLRILTHCNTGWLATVGPGTALAPVYLAHRAGIPLHVWVGETRPRNQGAALTAWELGQAGIPHAIHVDGAAGHLLQRGLVDLCIVGTDRTTATGDVANKVGTYPKALAARDNGVPFYVAAPTSSIDWTLDDGGAIPIEERDGREVTHLRGPTDDGREQEIRLAAAGSPAVNPAFDLTPARLVTALVTEYGVVPASREGLDRLKGHAA